MVAPLNIRDLDTPLVTVDLGKAEANIAKLQSYLNEHGIANRPHIKTHKLPLLARRQVEAGAVGVTVQTLGEAEVMAAAGINDILLTYDVIGPRKAARLARLAGLVHMSVAIDNEVALQTVAQAAAMASQRIGVLVEFESGKQRQGVMSPAEALTLAEQIGSLQSLDFVGLLTYPASPAIGSFVAEALALFSAAGVQIRTVSAGGTPNVWRAHEIPGLNEYRAGTSVYHDRKSVHRGEATLEECALLVHATVVSMATLDRGVIDAGSKVLTSDLMPPSMGAGYGFMVDYPDAVIRELSEEHGIVDFARCQEKPRIGDRVRVLPNHVCPVSNLVDEVVLHRNGAVLAVTPVSARGKR